MKIDIQKIFSQYGITNTMHNDAYDWWRRRYLRNGNTKNKYNFIRDIILCVSFIGVYIGILLFLGLLINGKVISELSKNPLIAVIFLLLLIFQILKPNQLNTESYLFCIQLFLQRFLSYISHQ